MKLDQMQQVGRPLMSRVKLEVVLTPITRVTYSKRKKSNNSGTTTQNPNDYKYELT